VPKTGILGDVSLSIDNTSIKKIVGLPYKSEQIKMCSLSVQITAKWELFDFNSLKVESV